MTSITILRSLGGAIATKTFTRLPTGIKVKEYDHAKTFLHDTYDVDNIKELSDCLTLIESRPTWMIIRGQIMPEHAHRKEVTRTLHDDPTRDQVAMFQDFPDGLRWVMLDFDKIDLPPGMTPQNGVEMLVHTLPVEFHDASYHYQLSSSAGVFGWDLLSAHVFFWLREPWTNARIGQWAKNLNATAPKRIIDPAVFSPVQANYTARPKFVGMDDPVGDQRSAFVEKSQPDVDLKWIDPPERFVNVNGADHKVGSMISVDGVQHVVTPSLTDRISKIGAGGEYRAPLKSALDYYYWYNGTAGNADEIKRLLWDQFPGGLPGNRNYLNAKPLDDLVRWYAKRHPHAPVYAAQRADDALKARLVAMRAGQPPLPDEPAFNDFSDWELDVRLTTMKPIFFVDGECGKGKTEWMLRRIGNQPGRYIVALPRIELILDFQRRFADLFPDAAKIKGYIIETIYSDKVNDVRDGEDGDDDHAQLTVPQQVKRFHDRIGDKPHVLLFITHAALHLSNWWHWQDFHLMVDEIFDPFVTYSRNFTRTYDHMKQFITIGGHDETHYYPLELTPDGRERIASDAFDDNEPALRAMMEALRLPNAETLVRKKTWESVETERLMLIRLTDVAMLSPFRSVTIMGDEFLHSMLAIGFKHRFGAAFQPHPDWQPTRVRKKPLAERVNIFYFASLTDRRGSLTYFDSEEIVPKLVKYVANQHKGQTLVTTNSKYRNQFFEAAKPVVTDVTFSDKVMRRTTEIQQQILWVEPKKSGTNAYLPLCNVAFFAAMRPSGDEIVTMSRSLGISEEEIIRWREYNTLYQFIMRCNLRDYGSDQVCNVYVFDQWQAEYLRERFGGCLSFTQVTGVIAPKAPKMGGRPKTGNAMTAAERKRAQRQRQAEATKAGASEASVPSAIDPTARLDEMMRKNRKR